jgi:hypothetical protein
MASFVGGTEALCWSCVAALYGGVYLGRDAPRTDIPAPNAWFFFGTNATTHVEWWVPDDMKGDGE